MELGEIIKNSFTYPFRDILKWLVVILIVFIGNLFIILTFYNPTHFSQYNFFKMISPFSEIFNMVSVICLILILGYGMNIFKDSIYQYFKMPPFNLKIHFINGLYHSLILIFYFFIPILIYMLISSMLTTKIYDFNNIFYQFGEASLFHQNSQSLYHLIMSVIPSSSEIIILISLGLIFILFELIKSMGLFLALIHDNFSEAFDIIHIFDLIYNIPIKVIYSFILIWFIFGLFVMIFSIINLFNGGLIFTLIGYSYLIIVYYRFTGLVYSNYIKSYHLMRYK